MTGYSKLLTACCFLEPRNENPSLLEMKYKNIDKVISSEALLSEEGDRPGTSEWVVNNLNWLSFQLCKKNIHLKVESLDYSCTVIMECEHMIISFPMNNLNIKSPLLS